MTLEMMTTIPVTAQHDKTVEGMAAVPAQWLGDAARDDLLRGMLSRFYAPPGEGKPIEPGLIFATEFIGPQDGYAIIRPAVGMVRAMTRPQGVGGMVDYLHPTGFIARHDNRVVWHYRAMRFIRGDSEQGMVIGQDKSWLAGMMLYSSLRDIRYLNVGASDVDSVVAQLTGFNAADLEDFLSAMPERQGKACRSTHFSELAMLLSMEYMSSLSNTRANGNSGLPCCQVFRQRGKLPLRIEQMITRLNTEEPDDIVKIHEFVINADKPHPQKSVH